jgi:hypothetical protein
MKPYIVLQIGYDRNGRVVEVKATDMDLRDSRHGDGLVQLPEGGYVNMVGGQVSQAFDAKEIVVAPIRGIE